jgi:hypothetical protein
MWPAEGAALPFLRELLQFVGDIFGNWKEDFDCLIDYL